MAWHEPHPLIARIIRPRDAAFQAIVNWPFPEEPFYASQEGERRGMTSPGEQ